MPDIPQKIHSDLGAARMTQKLTVSMKVARVCSNISIIPFLPQRLRQHNDNSHARCNTKGCQQSVHKMNHPRQVVPIKEISYGCGKCNSRKQRQGCADNYVILRNRESQQDQAKTTDSDKHTAKKTSHQAGHIPLTHPEHSKF